jgi:putative acetyltransferase
MGSAFILRFQRKAKMRIEIQQERPDTSDAVALITELDAYQMPLYPPSSFHGLSVEQMIREQVAFFVLRADGQAVGCGGLKIFADEYGEIKRMFVRPIFRGRGFARQIMNHLEEYARRQKVFLLRLETGVSQREAIGLYERMGYRKIAPFGDYPEDPLSFFYEKQIV